MDNKMQKSDYAVKNKITDIARWQQKYEELAALVAGNPRIEVSDALVRIPQEERTAFWNSFDSTREAFVSENFPDLLAEATVLAADYQKKVEEISHNLQVDLSKTNGPENFLRNPVAAVKKQLLDPLLDLLKGRLNTATFEGNAKYEAATFFTEALQAGYENWTMLSLLQLLEGDDIMAIPPVTFPWRALRDKKPPVSKQTKGFARPCIVPDVRHIDKIVYNHAAYPSLIFSDFVFHSAKLNAYVALRLGCEKAICDAEKLSPGRNWLPGETILPLSCNTILGYVADTPDDIALIGDAQHICQPDMIIECRSQKGWLDEKRSAEIKYHSQNLKPDMGTFILTVDTLPDTDLEDFMRQRITTVKIDFSQDWWTPILEVLVSVARPKPASSIKQGIFKKIWNWFYPRSIKIDEPE